MEVNNRKHKQCEDCKFRRVKKPPCLDFNFQHSAAGCMQYKKKRAKKVVVPYFRGVERAVASILAIDPGPEYSGYVHLTHDYKLISSGKFSNSNLLMLIRKGMLEATALIQEMLIPMGGAGKSVSDSLVWLGKFEEAFSNKYPNRPQPYKVLRITTRCHIIPNKKTCEAIPGLPKVADARIRYFLIERFKKELNIDLEKESKLVADAWQAMALAVFYMDKQKEKFG